MPNERDFSLIKHTADYQIAGNEFRAYYDAQGKLAFVLDNTIDESKPNVLLVLSPSGNRKWDDILANDMGVDLETVRPKKNNKYQNLDIEYTGLAVYDALINAYEEDEDLSDALAGLQRFRDAAARRAAQARLTAAEDVAEKSRDTIDAASESIVELQERVRELRAKLSAQRKSVGREPTKQSAAKILRTEAQIDATNDKIRRAKKRLSNAQKRLDDAVSDADVARSILARFDTENFAVSMPAPTDMIETMPAAVPSAIPEDKLPDVIQPRVTDLTITNDEQGALTMADENEEVKPLFDKDPEILDEEIAFKPIEFGVPDPVAVPAAAKEDEIAFEPIPTPLSFAPPSDKLDAGVTVQEELPRPIDVRPVVDVAPSVLDSMTPVVDERSVISETAPVAEVAPIEFTAAARPVATAVPDVAAAPIDSGLRPVSPIKGASVVSVGGDSVARKPGLVYYGLLLALIVLSIFTLWLYQRNASDTVPNLAASAPTASVAEEAVVDVVAPSPFLEEIAEVEPVEVAPTPDTPPVEEVAPVAVEAFEPVEIAPVPVEVETPADTATVEAVPVPVEVAPADDVQIVPVESEPASPFIDAPAPAAEVAEPVVNKPAYNVSQNENMFVAAADYDDGNDYYDYEGVAPVVEYKQPQIVSASVDYNQPVIQQATSEVFGQEVETCADGNAPDRNGCCTGEVFTDMEDGTFACCTPDGVDCFPPMN